MKLFSLFGVDDIAEALNISPASARVTASRYSRHGLLVRLKKDLYALSLKFQAFTEDELFTAASLIQTPSYISLTSALSYYNLSTQQIRGTIESVALKRTQSYEAMNTIFSFTRVQQALFTGFLQKNGFFIATPEKAVADSVYLTCLKRYNCDFDALNFKGLNKALVRQYLGKTDKRIKTYWDQLCRHYKI